jgi:hypothetical protein
MNPDRTRRLGTLRRALIAPHGALDWRARALPTASRHRFDRAYGDGRLQGPLEVAGVAASRPVLLLQRDNLRAVALGHSDAQGQYQFDGLDPQRDYLLIGLDDRGEYNAAVLDRQRPTPAAPE